MVSARTGGLVVALGVGYAVMAATGVASADSTDGPSGADSTSTSQSGESTSPASESADPSPSASRRSSDTSTPPRRSMDTRRDAEESSDGAGAEGVSQTSADPDVDAPSIDKEADFPPAVTPDVVAADAPEPEAAADTPVVDDTTVTAPEPPFAGTEDVIALASADVSDPAPEVLAPAPSDVPATPTASPAMWTLAAAARREIGGVTPVVANADGAAATPDVVAIEQVAPLAFLQRLPILGPLVFAPIVAVLHLIPIVSDVLHPLVGYPVRWGQPDGAPVARDVRVVSADGTQIYVHFMPAHGLATGQTAPTVLNGPGLGAPGATNIDGTLFDPFLADFVGIMGVGTLRRAGYNVVTWDPRGEWNSGGTLELNAAEFEGRDMSAIISWIATQPEVLLDQPGDPRLGMVGVSYGGAIQLVTAARDKRVDAIVPAITYNRLDTSLYKNEAFKSSWATPLTALLTVLGGRINPRILPATLYGDLTGQLTPSDLALFVQRNPAIANITVPTLLIHGTVDTIFSLAEADATAQTLLTNGVPTKVVWFCGGHGLCANNLLDFRDGVLIQQRTLAWLDRYVKEDLTVTTGPGFEWVDQRGQWFSSAEYPVTEGRRVVATLAARRTLPLIPYINGAGLPFIPYSLPAINGVELRVPASTATTYLVGAPTLTLTYSGTGTARHVYAQLFDNTTGLVLGSLATPVPVNLDGDTHTVTIDLEPVAHTLRPGESVTLQLVSSAGLYERIVPSLGTLTVSGMQVSVPTVAAAIASSASAQRYQTAVA